MASPVLKINGEDLGNLSWFGVMISHGYLGTIEKIMLLIARKLTEDTQPED